MVATFRAGLISGHSRLEGVHCLTQINVPDAATALIDKFVLSMIEVRSRGEIWYWAPDLDLENWKITSEMDSTHLCPWPIILRQVKSLDDKQVATLRITAVATNLNLVYDPMRAQVDYRVNRNAWPGGKSCRTVALLASMMEALDGQNQHVPPRACVPRGYF